MVEVTRRIHENDPEGPYDEGQDKGAEPPALCCEQVGFTAAAIEELCRDLGVPIHIIWGETTIGAVIPYYRRKTYSHLFENCKRGFS